MIWNSHGVSLIQAIQELTANFKNVDYYIAEENVNSHFKYELIPKKIETQSTNFIVYDPETHNSDRARPYKTAFCRLSKLAAKYNLDLTQDEISRCKKDTLVFDGDNFLSNTLDCFGRIKGEERKVNNKSVENNIQLHAHNGSVFDTWIRDDVK